MVDAFFIEPECLRVTRPVVRVSNLPAAWQGVRMALWADTHSGSFVSEQYLQRIVDSTHKERPDVIILAGDIVARRDWPSAALMVAHSPACGRAEGVFASLGNRDSVTTMREVCRQCGIDLLVNQARVLRRGGQELCIAGVADFWRGQPDAAAALAGVGTEVPRVVIGHNPDYAEPCHLTSPWTLCSADTRTAGRFVCRCWGRW